jgi:hypothetical protein
MYVASQPDPSTRLSEFTIRALTQVHAFHDDGREWQAPRLVYALERGAFVLSEPGGTLQDRALFEGAIAFARRGELAHECLRYLRDSAARRDVLTVAYSTRRALAEDRLVRGAIEAERLWPG